MTPPPPPIPPSNNGSAHTDPSHQDKPSMFASPAHFKSGLLQLSPTSETVKLSMSSTFTHPSEFECDQSWSSSDMKRECGRTYPLPDTVSYADILDVLDMFMSPQPSKSSSKSTKSSVEKDFEVPTSHTRWNNMRAVTIAGDVMEAFILHHNLASSVNHAHSIASVLIRIGGFVPTFRVDHYDYVFKPNPSHMYLHRGLTNMRSSRSPALNALIAYPVMFPDDEAEPRALLTILRDLSEAFKALCHVAVSLDGQFVDYSKIRGSAGWRRSLVLLCELAHARENNEFSRVPDDEKKAHWFNLYNLLIFHAKLTYGHPMDLVSRGKFFNDAAYMIAGLRLTSIELEHDVLRRRMVPDDPRVPWRLRDEKDARMHFVLNCGAHSCPPLRPVEYTQVENHLKDMTERFIESNVQVDNEAKRVTASRLFKWFRKDFTPFSDSDEDLLKWIADRSTTVKSQQISTALERRYKLKFDLYNWADNGNPEAKPDIRFMSIYDLSFARNT